MNHKITDISIQIKNPHRVNISIDGKYRLSLDVYQLTELGIKNGIEITSDEITKWEEESNFGKLYGRTLEYCLMRPHSAKEVRDYLWRKTLTSKYKSRDGSVKERAGVSQDIASRVYDRLVEKGYIDDEKFTRYWLENRNATKGSSQRKLIAELRGKGVEQVIIDRLLPSSARTDGDEIQKIIKKRANRYDDDSKFLQYLVRQGFSYQDSRDAINSYRSDQAAGTELETD